MAKRLSGDKITEIREKKAKSESDKREDFHESLKIFENDFDISVAEFNRDLNGLFKQLKLEKYDEDDAVHFDVKCFGFNCLTEDCQYDKLSFYDVQLFCREFKKHNRF